MATELVDELASALTSYRGAMARTRDLQATEDHLRLAAVVEDLMAALKSHDTDGVKLLVLAFYRQVSDSLNPCPPEHEAMARVVRKVERRYVPRRGMGSLSDK